jgi:hypothetical protein
MKANDSGLTVTFGHTKELITESVGQAKMATLFCLTD